jgi:flavin reductase (DIM6/NTAB) family NADH-FMN oxidoreductase RutF
MEIDPKEHSEADSYKILTNVIVPRPIAWVTSMNAAGLVNLAPFSFFNAIGSDPLYLAVSVGTRDDGSPKDTAKNIEKTGAFVVNLVTEDLLAAMNVSAADFPPDRSEIAAAGLSLAPSRHIAVPRVADAQVSLECRLAQRVPIGSNTLFIGEIVMFHVAERLIGPRWHIEGFAPIGRLGSPSMYCRTLDRFELPRLSYAQVEAQA